jgi:serine/threonine-protein phosphatase 5
VLKLVPNDQDAQKKFKMCERAMKEAAFAAAIESEETVPLSQTIDVAAIPLESSYDGPGLENASVLSMDFVEAAIERFKQQKQLPKKYVLMILLAARERLLAQRSLLRLRLPDVAEPCFTVCGDTHGQFYDLLNIFTLGGMPSATNPYLFNGDFVDRGSFSFEVVTTLLMLSLAAPEGLYMLRGNHESKNMNKVP